MTLARERLQALFDHPNVKAFYAVLTPYQKGVFDAHAAHGLGRGGRHGGHKG